MLLKCKFFLRAARTGAGARPTISSVYKEEVDQQRGLLHLENSKQLEFVVLAAPAKGKGIG